MLKGLANPKLLDSYSAERVPVVRAMLGLSTKLLDQTFSKSKADQAVAWNRSRNLSQLGVNYRWSPLVIDSEIPEDRKAAMKDGEEAYGRIEDNVALRAGDRTPDAPGLRDTNGQTTRVFDEISSSMHTALIFSSTLGSTDGILNILAKWPANTVRAIVILPQGETRNEQHVRHSAKVLVDSDGHAYTGFLSHRSVSEGQTTVVLIRPDCIVGAFVQVEAGIDDYRRRVFGS